MKISDPFNRFYHAILNEAFTKARSISFRQWKDTNTGTCLIFHRGEDYDEMDELKQIFKLMNIDLPVDGEDKLSTTKVDNKQLAEHIEFITRILNENGVTFNHDDEEWKRLKVEAGIISKETK
ncbi:hypothetical protein DRJ25_03945 [Candidatus Woesearchaeota archaeon]|nr:MAG: hypothetical protein DRJ25_03945 [Candidatus Woesearchaeota archaeon]